MSNNDYTLFPFYSYLMLLYLKSSEIRLSLGKFGGKDFK